MLTDRSQKTYAVMLNKYRDCCKRKVVAFTGLTKMRFYPEV